MKILLLLLTAALLPAQQYFPPGVPGDYSKFLNALHEPSLWELSQQDPKAEVYRFLWLRTFHRPISVRLVVRASGSGWTHLRMTTGRGGYEPGRIIRWSMFWRSKSSTQSFISAWNAAGIWNLPTLAPEDPNTVHLDGAHWILESVRDGKYHLVDRYAPQPSDPVRVIGLLALKLARVRPRPADIY